MFSEHCLYRMMLFDSDLLFFTVGHANIGQLLVKLRKLKKPQLQTKFNIMKLKSDKEMKDQFVIEVKN